MRWPGNFFDATAKASQKRHTDLLDAAVSRPPTIPLPCAHVPILVFPKPDSATLRVVFRVYTTIYEEAETLASLFELWQRNGYLKSGFEAEGVSLVRGCICRREGAMCVSISFASMQRVCI